MTEDAPLRDRLYPYRDLFPSDSRMHNYDKIPVEQTYLGEPDLPGTILRLPAVYGPDDYQHRPFPYLKRMVDGRRWIILDGQGAQWRWSRTFVDNAAEAISRAVVDDRAVRGVYNVAEPTALNEAEWVRVIGAAFGWSGEVVTLPTEDIPGHLRDEDLNFAQDLVVDTARIRDELDYREPVGAEEAIRQTVEWELANLPDELPPHRFDYEAEDTALPDLTLGIWQIRDSPVSDRGDPDHHRERLAPGKSRFLIPGLEPDFLENAHPLISREESAQVAVVEHRGTRSIVLQEVGEVGDVGCAAGIGIPGPFQVAHPPTVSIMAAVAGSRFECFFQMIGNEQCGATRPAVFEGRPHRRSQILFGRQVRNGVVQEDGIELPPEPHGAHIGQMVITLRIEAAAHLEHSR
jgi:hypothetical protein